MTPRDFRLHGRIVLPQPFRRQNDTRDSANIKNLLSISP